MTLPETMCKEAEGMPATLRALLKAELAAGNTVTEVGHTFPAPPAGAYFKLAQPLLTRAPQSADGLDYYDRNGSGYAGEITDAKRFYFLLEPPHRPAPEPDMDAVRAVPIPADRPLPPPPGEESAVGRFQRSMVIDYEKWHDGIGYDLQAIGSASPEERTAIERIILGRGGRDWRDIEALAALDTSGTRQALKAALHTGNPEIRAAVTGYAPKLFSDAKRAAALAQLLGTAQLFGGLTPALDQAAQFHPPKVVAALFRGALEREGEVAVHFSALLLYIFGRAPEPFDWEQRPFFLRFNTDSRREREAAFLELCARIGPAAVPYARKLAPPAPRKQLPKKPAPVAVAVPDFIVEIDVPGERLTYREARRSATVTCIFGPAPCVAPRTLSRWIYPAGRPSARMAAGERKEILARIVDYCRNRHGLLTIHLKT